MKFCICNDSFQGWKLEDIFKYAAETGYQAVEIGPSTICDSVTEVSQKDRERIHSSAEKAGVEIAGLHGLFRSPSLHLNSPDAKTRLRTKQYLRELVKFCSDIGGSDLVIGSGKNRNVVEGVGYKDAWGFARDAFSECSKLAQQYRTNLCIEALCYETTNFINTPEEAVKMVKEVNQANFRWTLDVYGMNCQGVDIVQAIRKFGGYLGHMHVNDDNKSWPGSGGIDFKPIAKALRDIDYGGYISIEVFNFEPDPETIAQEGIKYMKAVFE